MASIENDTSTPTSPKDTVEDTVEDTDDSKLNKLDQLLNKTNIYSTFISEKFKASKTYGTVVSTTQSQATKEANNNRGRGGRKRKNEGDPHQKSLQQKVDEVSSSDTQTLTTQPALITGM
jgi:hypothetical protein